MAQQAKQARVVIAGLAGDTGKTLISLGLVRALRKRGLRVAPFKKGPDFIDAAWLSAASGVCSYNLDSFMMPKESILASVSKLAQSHDIAVIEGNRGLFDGMDADGSHSTAQLAKLLNAPVVLVVDVTKATRTVAAMVLGCQTMDPELNIVGVILNRVGTARQENVIREAIAAKVGIKVLGAIPKLKHEHLPSRHLGLITAIEHPESNETLDILGDEIEQHVDVDAVLKLAGQSLALPYFPSVEKKLTTKPKIRIGVLRDKAFSFYYQENFTALKEAGAELIHISPLQDCELPNIDALYAGGGFPEVYAAELSANGSLKQALAQSIADGLPVWAECGGLMYLSQAVVQDQTAYEMVGALPITIEQTSRPQGHGYVKAQVDKSNPFLPNQSEFCGHEFHYSKVRSTKENLPTIFSLSKGVGVGNSRDGFFIGNVVAGYTHLHAFGVPEWASGFVSAATTGVMV